MFNLLEHIYNPQIFELILGISDLASNRYKFSHENIVMIAEYLNHSTWFQELCSLMLSYDHFEKFKKEKTFKMKAIHAIQRNLLKKVQENEKTRLIQTKKQALNEISQTLNEESSLQIILKDSKKNTQTLNTLFNSKKANKIITSEDVEYLFYQELQGTLPNIDKINVEEIQQYHQKQNPQSNYHVHKGYFNMLDTNQEGQVRRKSNFSSQKYMNTLNTSQEEEEHQQLRLRTSQLVQQSLNSSTESSTGQSQFSERALFKIKRIRSKLTLLSLTNKTILEARRNKQLQAQISRRNNYNTKQADGYKNSALDITEQNRSLFSTQNGFHSSKLVKPYPNYKLMQVNSDIEQMAKSKEFFSERIIAKEFYSYPCSLACLTIIRNIFIFEEQYKTLSEYRKQLGKRVGTDQQLDILKIKLNLVEMILDENALNFERIFMNYLIKMRVLTKLSDVNNSAYLAGQIINILLQNINSFHDKFANVFKKIKQMCFDYFDYCCKTIMFLDMNKNDPFILQNLRIKSPIGQSKIILVQTISLVIEIIQRDEIFGSLPDSIWHTMLLWFFNSPQTNKFLIIYNPYFNIYKDIYSIQRNQLYISIQWRSGFVYKYIMITTFKFQLMHQDYLLNYFLYRTSSIFGKHIVKLLNNTFTYANQKHITSILFKLSAISCLYNAYDDLTHSNKPIRSYHIDTFILSIKHIVVSLRMMISDRKFFDILNSLQSLTSWQKLIQIIPKNIIESIHQKDSYMLSQQVINTIPDHRTRRSHPLHSQFSIDNSAQSSHSLKYINNKLQQGYQISSFKIQNEKESHMSSFRDSAQPKPRLFRNESIVVHDSTPQIKNQSLQLPKVIEDAIEVSPILTYQTPKVNNQNNIVKKLNLRGSISDRLFKA